MIFDTHIHLMEKVIYDNLDNELKEAQARGVTDECCIGYDKESSYKALEISLQYPHVYAAIGLQPEEIKKESDDNLTWLIQLLEERSLNTQYQEKIVAIGEIGLDYYWEKDDADRQKILFRKQLDLAQKYNLPVVIHCRNAIQDTYDILKGYPTVKGVIHCYSGSLEMAKLFIKLGYYIGVGGVVTFKNSKEIKEVVKELGLNHFVSETDAPYLAPVPHRGESNKPQYVRDVVDYMGELCGKSAEETQSILYRNALDLFRLPHEK